MKLIDKIQDISEIWNETKSVRSDAGFSISSLEYTTRAESMRVLTGSTLAITPIIGLWGGNFFYDQYKKIVKSKKYATHPQGRAYIRMDYDSSGKCLVFLAELGLQSYYAMVFAEKFL